MWLVAAFLLLLSLAAQAQAVDLYVVASEGLEVPGAGTTDAAPGSAHTSARTALLGPDNGEQAVSVQQGPGGAGGQLVDAYLLAGHVSPVTLASGAQVRLAVTGGPATWTATLYDYDPTAGTSTPLGRGTTPSMAGPATVTVTLDNPQSSLLPGHALRLAIGVSKPPDVPAGLVFSGPGDEAIMLVIEEVDITAPQSSFSTSPPAPDGDDDWFISPVGITLSANDPEDSPAIILYDWGLDPPASVYAGSFLAPSGVNTLFFRALDAFGNEEQVRSQEFRVDTSASPPDIRAPRGEADAPAQVRGSITYEARAEDAVSGVAGVAFYYFAAEGEGWHPVGAPAGATQTSPTEDSLYRVSWETVTAADGLYMLQAQVRDVAGNMAFSAPQFVMVDNTVPTLELLSPLPGQRVAGEAFRIRGSVGDEALADWHLERRALPDGTWETLAEGQTPTEGVLYSLDTTGEQDGDHDLRLTASDRAGNRAVVSARITVDNRPPELTSAESGGPNAVQAVFDESVDPAGVAPERFSIPGLILEEAVLQSDGRTVLLVTSEQVDGRSYSLSASVEGPSVTDLAGNPPSPTPIEFVGSVVDRLPPAVPLGLEARSDAGRNDLAWSPNLEPDLEGYRLYRGSDREGEFSALADLSLGADVTSASDSTYGTAGVYWYRISAVDGAGNESAMSPAVPAERVRLSTAVGPAGAVVGSSTGEIELTVPPDLLTEDVTIEILEGERPADEGVFTFVSPAYELLPADLDFGGEVLVRLRYPPTTVDRTTVRLLRRTAESWAPVLDGSDTIEATDEVTGRETRSGVFAAAATDVTPPELLEQSPEDGAEDVSVREHLALTFSKPMDPSTLTPDSLVLGAGDARVALEEVAFSSDLRTVYLYPEGPLEVSTAYVLTMDSEMVTDSAGNRLPGAITTTFATADRAVSPHDRYADSEELCGRCHGGVSGEEGIFTERTEREVCYSCHDGTGSSLNVKTRPASRDDESLTDAGDFGEFVLGGSERASFHPVPRESHSGTGVTMVCSHCHSAHPAPEGGTGALAVKPLEPTLSGRRVPAAGNDFCWTCHGSTPEASAGYLSGPSWAASTGFDHRSFYPPPGLSHNDLEGLGVAAAGDPAAANGSEIACMGCHSEHASNNSKLVAETIAGSEVAFSAGDPRGYDTTYNGVCFACHGAAGRGGFAWPGRSSYEESGHGSSISPQVLPYSLPVPAGEQEVRTGVCKHCHEPHGAGDENGAFANLTRHFEEGVCFTCHGATGNPVGARDLATSFGRPVAHDLDLSTTAERRHDLAAEYAAPLNPNPRQSGSDRNVECADCHNPHASDARVNEGVHLRGTAEVSGSLKGVWGVEPANGAAWSESSAWDWNGSRTYPASFEYQICLKCHSAAAYGDSPPPREPNETRGTDYWPVDAYTDQAQEFNPENASYHAVWGSSKASGHGEYVNGWTATSRMYCSDCHRSDVDADPVGPHGSGTPFLLGGSNVPGNSRYVTGPRMDPYADRDSRDADYTFCFECHSAEFANTGFSTSEGENLHTALHETAPCTACHAAVPHGWQRDHLLVLRSDPAPYNDHGPSYGIPDSVLWQESTEWTPDSCHNEEGTGCH